MHSVRYIWMYFTYFTYSCILVHSLFLHQSVVCPTLPEYTSALEAETCWLYFLLNLQGWEEEPAPKNVLRNLNESLLSMPHWAEPSRMVPILMVGDSGKYRGQGERYHTQASLPRQDLSRSSWPTSPCCTLQYKATLWCPILCSSPFLPEAPTFLPSVFGYYFGGSLRLGLHLSFWSSP